MVVSLLLTPVLVNIAHALRLYDHPTEVRRVHVTPIPRLGGVAVFGALAFTLIAAGSGILPSYSLNDPRLVWGIVLGGAVVFVAGLWDDLRGLSPAVKLGAQCVAAAVAFGFGFRIEVLGFGTSTEIALGWLSFPITLLWVVGVTNAFNLIDGLDGLATGIAIVALGTIVSVALLLGNAEVAFVCAALLGALIGFLRYNFNPARIFLGDSGSLFVGFMLAVLSVYGSLKSATAVMAVIPLSVLALPLLDTGLAIARRWLRGVPLSGADARHVHHRLLALGLTHRRAVLVLYFAATAVATLGVTVVFAPPATVMGVALLGGSVLVAVTLYGMRRLDYHEFIEAGAVLAFGVMRVRRIIQDQIHAREMAEAIRAAATFEQVETILEENATKFGFLGIEVCRESSPVRLRDLEVGRSVAGAWKLDHPVVPRVSVSEDPYVLRIWCERGVSVRPYAAERVALILAPTIENWLIEAGLVRAVARPQPTAVSLAPAAGLADRAAAEWQGLNGRGPAVEPRSPDGVGQAGKSILVSRLRPQP